MASKQFAKSDGRQYRTSDLLLNCILSYELQDGGAVCCVGEPVNTLRRISCMFVPNSASRVRTRRCAAEARLRAASARDEIAVGTLGVGSESSSAATSARKLDVRERACDVASLSSSEPTKG